MIQETSLYLETKIKKAIIFQLKQPLMLKASYLKSLKKMSCQKIL
jgi:hypothetical protein